MSKKQPRNTKGKIISAAWKLFYEQGYDDTTIDEIIAESGTSKGSFYLAICSSLHIRDTGICKLWRTYYNNGTCGNTVTGVCLPNHRS